MSDLSAHVQLLRDQARIEAYRGAIEAAVKPGDVVVDLGAGIGVLSVIAAKAGASRVYALESEPMIASAIELVSVQNDCAAIVETIRGDSRKVDVPERADLVIYDDVDIMDPRGTVVDTLRDARDRWLKPNGASIPAAITLRATLVDLDDAPAKAPVEIPPPLIELLEQPRPMRVDLRHSFLAEPVDLASASAWDFGADGLDENAQVVATRRGTVRGLLIWLEIRMDGVHVLDCGNHDRPSAYPQMLLPLDDMAIDAGQALRLSIRYQAPAAKDGFHRFWDWQVEGPSGASAGNSFSTSKLGPSFS